jgi:hypothetical protein
MGGKGLIGLGAFLLFLGSCGKKEEFPPFHSPLDLLPGSAHTVWIWDAPYPVDAPGFLQPKVPPKLLGAEEGALSLVRIQKRGEEKDAPIGGFDFGSKTANDQVLEELQGQVYRDLRFGTVSGLILLRGQLKADDVGGPGLSRQTWFVKTKLGLDFLLPSDRRGSLRLILDPRRSRMMTSWSRRIPKRFQTILGYRSFLSFGLGSQGHGSLVAYAQLVREPEGLVSELRDLPEAIVDRFRSIKASWLCLGLDLESFITEGLADFTSSDDPLKGGAIDFLSSPLLKALGPFGDPKIRASLGKVLAIASHEELGPNLPKDPSRFLFLLGLKDAESFEAACVSLAQSSSGKGAKFLRLKKLRKGKWNLHVFGFQFRLDLRKDFVLISSPRTRDLARDILEGSKKPTQPSAKEPSKEPSKKAQLLEGVLHFQKKSYKLGLRRFGRGLVFEMK